MVCFKYVFFFLNLPQTSPPSVLSALTPSHFTSALFFPFFPLPLVSPPSGHHVIPQTPLCPPTCSPPFPWASYLSFSSHLLSTPQIPQPPPATFPLSCCRAVQLAVTVRELAAPTLAGMASFLWWHNVVAMSYALKQWFDVTAVSASLSNAGGGRHIPAGNALSDKLMSAAQPPRRRKTKREKKHPCHHTRLWKSWQNCDTFMCNNSVYTAWCFGHNNVTHKAKTEKCSQIKMCLCDSDHLNIVNETGNAVIKGYFRKSMICVRDNWL